MDLFYLKINDFDSESESKQQKQHLAGRFILEYAAKNFFNIENTEIEIINKKPKFKYSNIHFSISHSDDVVAVCFDVNPVGFDIEKIIDRDYKSIAKRMKFKLEEDSLNAFYKCWTKYEAKYKLQANANYFYNELFAQKYAISVASEKTTDIEKKLNIHEITF